MVTWRKVIKLKLFTLLSNVKMDQSWCVKYAFIRDKHILWLKHHEMQGQAVPLQPYRRRTICSICFVKWTACNKGKWRRQYFISYFESLLKCDGFCVIPQTYKPTNYCLLGDKYNLRVQIWSSLPIFVLCKKCTMLFFTQK